MNIVTKDELCKYPNGTVFMEYIPDMTDGRVHIMTGSNGKDTWNGEITLDPIWKYDKEDPRIIYTNWCTIDTAYCDYDSEQKFIVFSKEEVANMINILTWALSGCDYSFNEDIWFDNNGNVWDEKDVELWI